MGNASPLDWSVVPVQVHGVSLKLWLPDWSKLNGIIERTHAGFVNTAGFPTHLTLSMSELLSVHEFAKHVKTGELCEESARRHGFATLSAHPPKIEGD